MWSSLKLVQTFAPQHVVQLHDLPDFEQQKDVQDEELIIFWIGLPQKTTSEEAMLLSAVPAAAPGQIEAQGLCGCQWSGLSMEARLTLIVSSRGPS